MSPKSSLAGAGGRSPPPLSDSEMGCFGALLQVPQFILEHECRNGRGGDTNVVVTQPRRIAAIALAEVGGHGGGRKRSQM